MLARLIALLATGEAGVVKRRLKTVVASYLAIGAAVLLALIFLVLAAYLAAAVRWGAIQAALGFGIAFVVVAIAVYIVFRILGGAQRRAQQKRRAADASMLAGASAVAALPTLVSKKGGLATVLITLAGIAGYAAYRELSQRGHRRRRR